jgi:ribosome biogenesis GTPase A
MHDIGMGRIPLQQSVVLHDTPGVLDKRRASSTQVATTRRVGCARWT